MNIAPILIVDRNPDDVEFARAYLQDQNIANPIDTAESGRDALAYLDADASLPALILIQLGDLSDMSGSELLSRLRADARTVATPVFAFSSSAHTAPAPVGDRPEPLVLLTRPIAFPHFGDFVRALNLELRLVSAPEPARSSEAS